jgi:phenylacetate-CoA ligase
VVCTGDTLYPHYREAIREAFGAPLFDNYGGEGMCVANQCAAGAKHVLPSVHVEFRPQPGAGAEQPCRLVLTCLTNTAMPMIRYDIADLGVPGAGACPCGRHWAVLKELMGRETDIVVTPSGRHLVCHHFNNILRQVEGVLQFQVIQERPGGMELRLETDGRYRREADEAAIRRQLAGLAGEGFDVRFAYLPAIPVPASGKRRYIVSSVGMGGGAACGS